MILVKIRKLQIRDILRQRRLTQCILHIRHKFRVSQLPRRILAELMNTIRILLECLVQMIEFWHGGEL